MSVTVTPSAASGKPQVLVQVSSSNGSPITSVTLARTTYGYTESTRFQPTAGPSPRIVSDYEPAWGTPVTYTAVVKSGAGTETFTSPAVTVNPDRPWMIHPTTPGLSRAIDSKSTSGIGVVSIGAVSRPSATTAHDVIGARYRVVTRVGPRQASRVQMEIATVSQFEEQMMWALVDDQTPLLIRVPTGWGWSWEDGYYDVGQVDASRVIQYGAETRRVFTLPLERVEAPSGTQQADRTYTDVQYSGLTNYTQVQAAFATYADLLVDNRKS